MKAVLLLSVFARAFATSIAADVCSLPHEKGMCLGYFPRYYYNQQTNECEKFIYGGCQGNANNFKTKEECLSTCGIASEVCTLPPEQGMCRGFFPRYYYDQEDEECYEFIYGGCKGNDNKFETLEDCEDTCVN